MMNGSGELVDGGCLHENVFLHCVCIHEKCVVVVGATEQAITCTLYITAGVGVILYSGNLSQVKTFAVLGQFAKVLTARIFVEYGAVIINGRVIVVSHN